MSQTASLLGLPTELLDRIYSYLDWSRFDTLIPIRPDLLALSVTCKHLRATVAPLLFRNVTLCLRWHDGILLEPGLYQLRRQRPDLAQHIRCVYLTTKLGYRPGTQGREEVKAFTVPESLHDWLSPGELDGPDRRHQVELVRAHRERVQAAVDELHESLSAVRQDESAAQGEPSSAQPASDQATAVGPSESPTMYKSDCRDIVMTEESASAEDRIRHLQDHLRGEMRRSRPLRFPRRSRDIRDNGDGMNDGTALGSDGTFSNDFSDLGGNYGSLSLVRTSVQRHKLRADALAALMLCLPATINELVFEAGVHGLENKAWYHFALYFMDAAFRIFGHRLESSTMATGTGGRDLPRLGQQAADSINISRDAVAELKVLKRLVLASTSATPENFNVHQLYMGSRQLQPWSSPSLEFTVTTVELWNTNVNEQQLPGIIDFLKPFSVLQSVRFKNTSYATRGLPSRIYPHTIGPEVTISEAVWLHFCISLRRALPLNTEITMSHIAFSSRGQRAELPVSALRWIMNEAVPVGDVIDHQREERLFEDFESFLMLWEAEDSERGRHAEVERRKGELVDVAMCNRSRQFENVRRDKGEWVTF